MRFRKSTHTVAFRAPTSFRTAATSTIATPVPRSGVEKPMPAIWRSRLGRVCSRLTYTPGRPPAIAFR